MTQAAYGVGAKNRIGRVDLVRIVVQNAAGRTLFLGGVDETMRHDLVVGGKAHLVYALFISQHIMIKGFGIMHTK
jgi:hypothetical protein